MGEALDTCSVHGCEDAVNKPGHTLCYAHWKAKRSKKVDACAACGVLFEVGAGGCPNCTGSRPEPPSGGTLTATKLGKELGLSSQKTNLVLAELGWIEKATKGWKVTKHGQELGASQKRARQSGVPYVAWPGEIAGNAVLRSAVAELVGDSEATTPGDATQSASRSESLSAEILEFRAKFPATHRARDGHLVRSRAEMLIDNFLYVSGLVHAYERRLPILDENVYSDFYLPNGKVFIEYWGLESQPKYRARMEKKKAIYAREGFKLISLTDDHIPHLDEVLERLLLQFDISIG